jgi:hypothetical protein
MNGRDPAAVRHVRKVRKLVKCDTILAMSYTATGDVYCGCSFLCIVLLAGGKVQGERCCRGQGRARKREKVQKLGL